MPKNQERRQQANSADIEKYLKSPRPSSWLILTFALVVVAMAITWSLIGTMKTTVAITGIKSESHFTGYLKPADSLSLEAGMPIELEGEQVGALAERDTAAYSKSEVEASIDDAHLSSQLSLNEHNVKVTADIDPASCSDGVVTLEIVTAKMRPFDFFMG